MFRCEFGGCLGLCCFLLGLLHGLREALRIDCVVMVGCGCWVVCFGCLYLPWFWFAWCFGFLICCLFVGGFGLMCSVLIVMFLVAGGLAGLYCLLICLRARWFERLVCV